MALYASFVYNIVEDDHRRSLWMTCSKGAFRVSKQELNDFADGKIKSSGHRSSASNTV